jgi:hypothetical protein
MKGGPCTEREARLDIDACDSDMKVASRHIEPNDLSRKDVSGEAEHLFDRSPFSGRQRLLLAPGFCRRQPGYGDDEEESDSAVGYSNEHMSSQTNPSVTRQTPESASFIREDDENADWDVTDDGAASTLIFS